MINRQVVFKRLGTYLGLTTVVTQAGARLRRRQNPNRRKRVVHPSLQDIYRDQGERQTTSRALSLTSSDWEADGNSEISVMQ